MISTEFSMMSPIYLKLIILMVCVAFQVVGGEHQIECLEREREALLRVKASLVDPNGMLSSWTTAHCCQWKLIRCNNLTGNIVSLDLHAPTVLKEIYHRKSEISPSWNILTSATTLLKEIYHPNSEIFQTYNSFTLRELTSTMGVSCCLISFL
ncbi:hypothetical protein VIGAN_11124200 [Vigna angularis var. angularis]|uniref:Leucine-rich repeat-containing N-terminal plant-type domain-containing protein n=1 Tax=Vigna angularis var. angularis TaxID=157739 RepID=A0A0S3TA48_PHAAN|nr:hypothetical protein VIGAN_11124200 [Vigna angularis var. angularis]